jgi:hypothetical protein
MAVGLLRITDELLKPLGSQRDRKRKVNERGIAAIVWAHRCDLAFPNILLSLESQLAERISREPHGTKAVELLFREAQGRLIDRTAVQTAAQQVDAMRRARGARKPLSEEGILIFGHYEPHPALASSLGLPRPTLGRYVSATVAPWSDGDVEPYVLIEDGPWRLARPGEATTRAPQLPVQGKQPG